MDCRRNRTIISNEINKSDAKCVPPGRPDEGFPPDLFGSLAELDQGSIEQVAGYRSSVSAPSLLSLASSTLFCENNMLSPPG